MEKDFYVRKSVICIVTYVILPEKHHKKTDIYLRDRRDSQSILLNLFQKERELNCEVVCKKSLPSFHWVLMTMKGGICG